VPPAFSAKYLPGGRTQLLNARGIKWIDCHSAGSDEDSACESILDTENYLDCNGHLDNWNISADDWEADNEFDIQWHNWVEDSENTEQWNVSSALNLVGLIWSTEK
jgi:hypothetical protein